MLMFVCFGEIKFLDVWLDWKAWLLIRLKSFADRDLSRLIFIPGRGIENL